MKKTALKKMKVLLTEQRQALVAMIVARHNTSQDGIDLDGDEVDYIQGRTLAITANKLSERDRAKLNQIDQAIKRIDAGDFGDCEECEEEIGEKRLLALPFATICVDCAELKERERKQMAQ